MHSFRIRNLIFASHVLAVLLQPAATLDATDYFVSWSAGADANIGTSSDAPWKTLERVNDAALQPGDRVHLKAGDSFQGGLYFDDADGGIAASPVIVDSYGVGMATIKAPAGVHGVLIYNTGGITIRNLVISGPGAVASDANPAMGVFLWCDSRDGQRRSGVQVEDLIVHDFYIGIAIGAQNRSFSGFSDVVVSGCVVTDCVSEGITSYGYYPGSQTQQSHRNITVRDCVVAYCYGDPTLTGEHSGSGIILSGTIGGMIDRCVAHDNGGGSSDDSGGGPVGIWCWGCDSVTIQRCLVYNQRTTSGAVDGGGFDIDGGATNCVIQYCYSYNNDGPGYQTIEFTGASPLTNAVVRYNLSWNDGRTGQPSLSVWNGESSSGSLNNAVFHNNTVISSGNPCIKAPEGSHAFTAYFYNNILCATNGSKLVDAPNQPGGFTFKGNLYYDFSGSPRWTLGSTTSTSLESWRASTLRPETHGSAPVGVYADPLLNGGSSGDAATAVDSFPTLTALRPRNNSPAAGTGVALSSVAGVLNGGVDFSGAPVPTDSRSIGAYLVQWNGREVIADGWVATGNFLGWINVSYDPWLFQGASSTWLYADATCITPAGSWAFSPSLTPGTNTSGNSFSGYPLEEGWVSTLLGRLYVGYSPYFYSEAFQGWFYVNTIPFAVGNWIFAFDPE